jgi:glycosyltransferase involved in cell wall biosynthesis
MTVSIVIPCFNHARFLDEAVQSALAQTCRPLEVIVVNDGSTDGSGDLARRMAGVRVIDQDKQGLSAARNAGLAAARGDIVIFLDADDRLRPQAASAAVDAFRNQPSAAMAFGRCVLIDERGAPMPTNQPHVRGCYYEELLRRNFIWTPALVAFQRWAFAAIGDFDREVSPSADYDLYLRIARRFPIAAHDTLVAEYRQHGGNMSSDPVLMLKMTLRVVRRQRPFITTDARARAYGEGERCWREFYGERLVDRFRAALRRSRSRRAAMRDALHLLRLYPRGVARHVRRKAAMMSGRARDACRGNQGRDLARL